MTSAMIYDTEYLAIEGSIRRFWAGPNDPDPTIIQIGAVRIDLDDHGRIQDELNILIKPRIRSGASCQIGRYIEKLTGISNEILECEGISLTFDQRSI